MIRQEVIVRKKEAVRQETMKTVLAVMDSISYGSVTLLIQDGKILEIEKKEKIRLR